MPTKSSNLVKHINVLRDGKFIRMPTETVVELGHKIGHIIAGNPGVGFAYANIRDSKPHFHNHTTEWYLVTRGTGKLLLDGKEMQIIPLDVVMIPPGVTHAVKSENGLDTFVLSSPPWRKEDHILRDLKSMKR
jgi:mannose-6-phosphate isomerase-like protein (cupin superfamily)